MINIFHKFRNNLIMKHKCPNCGEFKFEEKLGKVSIGSSIILFSILGFLFTPGGSKYHGGDISFGDVGGISLLGILIGVLIIIYSFVFPIKTVTYKCKNCDYQKKYLKDKYKNDN